MCLIIFAYRQHPVYRLILAANRDEFCARPTAPLARWNDAPHVVAGRDLQAGGAWLGITDAGRFAAVTNYRDRRQPPPGAASRGLLVSDYLQGRAPPLAYLERLEPVAEEYGGFNLLLGDARKMVYFSNREARKRALTAGLYGLSNHLLDTPWPKVERGKRALRALLERRHVTAEALFELLSDRREAETPELPDTGVGLAVERRLSPVFIGGERYGTRSSTVLLVAHDGTATITERTHDPACAATRTLALETPPTAAHPACE